MQNFFNVDPNELAATAAALQQILKERGWRAKFLRGTHQYIFAERPDGETFNIADSAPEMTSRFSSIIASDKLATYELLNEIGVPQADTRIATVASISAMLEKYEKIVIKPIDGSHSDGITTDIMNLEDAFSALDLAEKKSDSGRALVQQQLDLNEPEVRSICIDYKFIEAIQRTHTDSEVAFEDVTDTFSKNKIQLSKRIATALDLPVIGIEFLGDYVLEVSASPSLYYPLSDEEKSKYGVYKLVDYLENF